MEWIAGLAVLALLVFVPKARKPIAGLVGLAALIAGGLYIYFQQQETARLERIKPSEIEVIDLKVHSSEVIARIRNHSRHTVTSLELRFVSQDCAPTCETVADDRATIYVTIPPGQARDVRQTVLLTSFRLRGEGKHTVDVVGVRSAN